MVLQNLRSCILHICVVKIGDNCDVCGVLFLPLCNHTCMLPKSFPVFCSTSLLYEGCKTIYAKAAKPYMHNKMRKTLTSDTFQTDSALSKSKKNKASNSYGYKYLYKNHRFKLIY